MTVVEVLLAVLTVALDLLQVAAHGLSNAVGMVTFSLFGPALW